VNGEVPLDVQANLARGVANMEVDTKAPTGPDQPALTSRKGIWSGLLC
jgi:hypothetical protein